MGIAERLVNSDLVREGREEARAILEKAIALKEKSVRQKEGMVELVEMLIINTINMVEEIEFVEKKTGGGKEREQAKAQEGARGVAELIKFFSSISVFSTIYKKC